MDIRWIEDRYIKGKSVEYREYQVKLANIAANKNTMILLPTGLGKTTIALLIIADMLKRSKKKILLMAPTRVLVHQHFSFLREHLEISDISIITGEYEMNKRENEWSNSIICATPQVVINDLEHRVIEPHEFALVIFDEAHRAIGNHAYTRIARLLKEYSRIIALTATIPTELSKAKEIRENLAIEHIEYRDEDSPDIKPYIYDTTIESIEVELPLIIMKIREYLKKAIDNRIEILKKNKIIRSTSITELIRVKEYNIVKSNKDMAKVVFTTIRLYHALKILDTQSVSAFVMFYERLKSKRAIGIYSLLSDPDCKNAYEIARGALISNIEHPKIKKLYEIINNEDGKVLIFTSYRDNVEVLYKRLLRDGYKVGYLIGKAGEDGLKQDEQLNTVQKFRNNTIKILIATHVGEEGLDISECNLVIFYDNVPSVIRFIQRKGRTGRKSPGKVILLVTKDTLDEAYSHISRRKIKSVSKIAKKINNNKGGILYL